MAHIATLETLLSLRPQWREDGKTVVWTNGCFDLLHTGHVRNLKEAKAQGDILIVGVNSDSSVRAIKGPERPIVPEAQRAEILSAIAWVDYVMIFDDPTPIQILSTLQPDVHCKGADYANGSKPMPEANVVHSYGGRIAYLDLHLNCSTSSLVDKIRGQAHDRAEPAFEGIEPTEGPSDALTFSLVDRLSSAHVMVVGDVMLDEYVVGGISRISPEAPVPIIDVIERKYTPGGAANVAANIAALGAGASLIGLVAEDAPGGIIKQLLQESKVLLDGLVAPEDRHTICKTRLVAGQQQIARVDQETKAPVLETDCQQMLGRVGRLLPNADVCILSDYAKGVLTERVCQEVIRLAREKNTPVIVDPKGRNYHKYRGCSVITPNVKEAGLAAGFEIDSEEDLHRASEILLDFLPGTCVLITRGPQGMTLFREAHAPVTIPTIAKSVFDVVGAGDTAVAALAVAIGADFEMETAIRLANTAAGIAVGKHGTVTVGIDELTAHPETFALLRGASPTSLKNFYAAAY